MSARAERLSSVFHALADPTRRAVVARLGAGPASTSALAEPFSMALPSFMQHLGVLEDSGLVGSKKVGRSRIFHLVPKPLEEAEDWMAGRRREWTSRLDRLDRHLLEDKDET